MEIILIRHGPPGFDSSRWLHNSDLGQLLAEYKGSRVVSPAPAELLGMLFAFTDKKVCCSELPRCVDSAAALGFSGAARISELNEADLPSPSWLQLPIPYRLAIVGLRLAWFLGYSGGVESYQSTQKRAGVAADKLIEIASVNGSVLVVGHGIMNRLVSRRLRKLGWDADSRDRSGYWSATRLTVFLSNGVNGADG